MSVFHRIATRQYTGTAKPLNADYPMHAVQVMDTTTGISFATCVYKQKGLWFNDHDAAYRTNVDDMIAYVVDVIAPRYT